MSGIFFFLLGLADGLALGIAPSCLGWFWGLGVGGIPGWWVGVVVVVGWVGGVWFAANLLIMVVMGGWEFVLSGLSLPFSWVWVELVGLV